MIRLAPEELKLLLISVGTHKGRRALSPVEVAELFQKAINAGSTLSECAEAVHFQGTTWVGRFLRLLSLPESMKHLVDWGGRSGIVGFSVASEIARLGNHAEEERVIQAVLTNRLNLPEVRQVVQLRKRSGRDIDGCIGEVLGMRPSVEKRHVYIGAITIPALNQKLSGMTQQQRDQVLGFVVSKVVKVPDLTLGKLGTENFTLVGGPVLGKTVTQGPDALEQNINQLLWDEISNVQR